MESVNICAYARTPVGKFRGSLSKYSATELGAMAVKELLKRAKINPNDDSVNQLYMGHVLQAGTGQAPCRQVALNAGMSYQTPCTTINKVCGSSLKAVMIGASDIRAKVANLIIAGGMESMSNAPYFIKNPVKDEKINFSDLEWVLSHDGLKDAYSGEMMELSRACIIIFPSNESENKKAKKVTWVFIEINNDLLYKIHKILTANC